MGELILVGIIVASAAAYLALRCYRQLGGRNGGGSCGCGGGGGGCAGSCQDRASQCSCTTSLDSIQPEKEV